MESYSLQIFGNFIAEAGKSFHKMYFIAAEDYGNQVAADLKSDSLENREYTIQGSEAFTYHEANKVFSEHAKKKLFILFTPMWVMKIGSSVVQQANYTHHILTALNNFPEKLESDRTWNELGKPQITLQEFANNYKF
jgi:hypothetical protein